MLYFAYGSNLDRAQMAARCPGSVFVATARLDGHGLHFPRRSPIRGCAVASIMPAEGQTVFGALYRMTADDLLRLDAREGYYPDRPDECRYDRVTIAVRYAQGHAVEAMTYLARPSPDPGLPSPEYIAHFIAGATLCGFPDAYLAMLRALPTSVDLDDHRASTGRSVDARRSR